VNRIKMIINSLFMHFNKIPICHDITLSFLKELDGCGIGMLDI